MTLDDAFLRAITNNPEDDTPRLIYADWLEEQGDPRGEFIRIQIAVAHERYCAARRLPLEARERELLERYQDTWLGALRPLLARWTFRRGFLDTVAVPASVYLQHAAMPRPATIRRFEVDLTGFEIPLSVLEFVPESVARENICLILGLRGRTLVIATENPHDDKGKVLMKLEFILNRDIELVAATKKQLIESINRHYDYPGLEEVSESTFVEPRLEFERDERRDYSPVARLVDLILAEAMHQNVMAVHLEPEPDCVRLRYHIDGQWMDRDTPPRSLLDPIVSRIGHLAGINFSEDLDEQTGQIRGASTYKSFHLNILVRRTEAGPEVMLTFLPQEDSGDR